MKKIQPLHDRIRDRCEKYVEPGQKIGFDECTLGVQVRGRAKRGTASGANINTINY